MPPVWGQDTTKGWYSSACRKGASLHPPDPSVPPVTAVSRSSTYHVLLIYKRIYFCGGNYSVTHFISNIWTKTRAWLLDGVTPAYLQAHEFPSKRFEIRLGAGVLCGQEKQIAVADGIQRHAEKERSAAPLLALSRVNSVGKYKYFLPSFILCGLGHGAGTPVVGGDRSAEFAQCLPLRRVQRVFWEATSQCRLLSCPMCGLYDLEHCVSVLEGSWRQVCFISSITMWPCKTA